MCLEFKNACNVTPFLSRLLYIYYTCLNPIYCFVGEMPNLSMKSVVKRYRNFRINKSKKVDVNIQFLLKILDYQQSHKTYPWLKCLLKGNGKKCFLIKFVIYFSVSRK